MEAHRPKKFYDLKGKGYHPIESADRPGIKFYHEQEAKNIVEQLRRQRFAAQMVKTDYPPKYGVGSYIVMARGRTVPRQDRNKRR
jgi:hypothetical protein